MGYKNHTNHTDIATDFSHLRKENPFEWCDLFAASRR